LFFVSVLVTQHVKLYLIKSNNNITILRKYTSSHLNLCYPNSPETFLYIGTLENCIYGCSLWPSQVEDRQWGKHWSEETTGTATRSYQVNKFHLQPGTKILKALV